MKLFTTIAASALANHYDSGICHDCPDTYDGECGGLITDFNTIVSPGYERGEYYDLLSCEWEIDLGDIEGFNIVPLFFDVEQDTYCSYDELIVIDGNGDEKIFCGTNSWRRRKSAGKDKKAPPRVTSSYTIKNDGFETLFVEGGKAVIRFTTDKDIREAGFHFELRKFEPTRLQIIEAHAQRIFDALADTGYGPRYQGRMEKIFAKLTTASASGEDCHEENGFGSEADGVLVFDDSDMCKLNGQVNAAINSFARRNACDGRGKVYRQIIRAARKVRNFMNEKHNCE